MPQRRLVEPRIGESGGFHERPPSVIPRECSADISACLTFELFVQQLNWVILSANADRLPTRTSTAHYVSRTRRQMETDAAVAPEIRSLLPTR